MAVNIKNNFGPIIDAKDNATINIGSDDALQRYEVIKKVVGENIEDAEFEELPPNKVEELKKACVSSSENKKPKKKVSTPQIVSTTFTYCYLNDYQVGIVRLYQALLKGNFIHPDTKPEDFCKIFMGKESDVKVKWIGKKAPLWYFFKLLFDRKYVSWPTGVGQWVIVQSHFVDENSRVFTDFNSQHEPRRISGAIDQIVELLNPTTSDNVGYEA